MALPVVALLLGLFAGVGPTVAEAAPVRREAPQDTLGLPADSLEALPDSLIEEPFVPRNLVSRPTPVPATWATGVWEWDREALRSTRALTVLELLEEVTGVIPLRGGDHGQPSSASAFGVGAGRIRVYLDGAELPPLDGGVVDLSRTGLAGLDRVRVERRLGELRIDLFPLQFSDPRPLSFLEVGTGDLNTNLFRGVFAHPNAVGGNIIVALDRIDTLGPRGQESGTSFGAHVRHSLFPRENLGISWEFRRMTSRRPEELWEPRGLERTDWGVRGRYEWNEWLHFGAFVQRSSLGADAGTTGLPLPGMMGDEALVNRKPRSQLGAHVSAIRDRWWIDVEHRTQGGPGWPSSNQSIRGGATLPAFGGASASVDRQGWDDGQTGQSYHARAWTRPFLGLSLFGEFESGTFGVPFFVAPDVAEEPMEGGAAATRNGPGGPRFQELPEEPPSETPAPLISLTDRTTYRAGLEYRRGAGFLGVAILSVEADSLHPLGLPTDRSGVPTAGGSRSGFEFSASLPLTRLMNGLELRGSTQLWDQNLVWRYLPERIYEGRLSFHDVFMESENLELWVDIGVRGRDPMEIPPEVLGTPVSVPFQQSWLGRLQIRVSSVRLFLLWDNFTLRQMNQDYPGRVLPPTRAMYGIRWTMWN